MTRKKITINDQKSIGYFHYFNYGLTGYVNRLLYRIRSEIYLILLKELNPDSNDKFLDVGVSDDEHSVSNFFEKEYPYKDNITALGLGDFYHLEKQFPGLKYVKGNGKELPFKNDSFDYVYSHAVIEHVGNSDNQKKFINELMRVARKGVLFTTPNRNHPIEAHTGIPLLHFLPGKFYRFLYAILGKKMYSYEENLNLLRSSDIIGMLSSLKVESKFQKFKYTRWLGFKSNIVTIIDCSFKK